MKPIILEDNCALFQGDSAQLGTVLGPNTVDAIVTDPPAGIGFMGKGWDSDKGGRDAWIAWLADLLRPAFAALKPGGHALVWAIPRTSHWTAMALELAGFEIRDVHHHLFGTGFPKSLNVSMEIDKRDAAEARRARALEFTTWMRSTGVTAAQIDAATGSNMGSHYLTAAAQPHVATADLFDRLRPLLPAVPDAIELLVRERTVESENAKKRPVTSVEEMPDARLVRPGFTGANFNDAEGLGARREVARTVAHTEEAARWDGWGTALKPAVEHWILARKPLAGTYAENLIRHGVGAINVDACRIGSEGGTKSLPGAEPNYLNEAYGAGMGGLEIDPDAKLGRWPAHLSLEHAPGCQVVGHSVERRATYANADEAHRDGDESTNLAMGRQIAVGEIEQIHEIHKCALGCPVRLLDEQSGVGVSRPQVMKQQARPAQKAKGAEKARVHATTHSDAGGASRFFYVAKPTRKEKDRGLEHLPVRSACDVTGREEGSAGSKNARAGKVGASRNVHPTPKSIALMRWLIRLITPPGGTVLDVFAGSGTTGVAAIAEGLDFVGVEQGGPNDEYIPVIEGRLRHAIAERLEFLAADQRTEGTP